MRSTLRQFAMYTAVGAIGTAAHYAVLITLVQAEVAEAPVATTWGFALGALINYRLNHRFTFRSKARHRSALPKFLLVAASGAVLNYLLVLLLTRQGSIHYLVAQVASTCTVLAWQYGVNRVWTFANQGFVSRSDN